MTTARLLLLLLLIVVAVVIVVVVLRRGSAQRDQQRAEAAGLRSEADTIAATMSGQSAFADQAAERAEVARVEAERKAREAEEKAREAQRLEDEAAQHRAAVESTQREYETTMRRADDLDPDVKESQFAPVEAGDEGAAPVDEPAPAPAGSTDAAPSADAGAVPAPAGDAGRERESGAGESVEGASSEGASPEDESAEVESAEDESAEGASAEPMTRAERREARLAAERSGAVDRPEAADDDGDDAPASTGWAAPTAASAAPAAGAVGAAAAGASAWGAPGDEPASAESERIASAADYRDDVAEERADVADGRDDVSEESPAGSDRGMSDQTRTERALADDTTTGDDTDTDLSRDVESPSGEWGGPPRDDAADGVTIIADPEAYATTEPVMASEQSPPVTPEPVGDAAVEHREADETRADSGDVQHGTDSDHATASDHVADSDHAPAETGAAVAEPDAADRSDGDVAPEPEAERFDPTPTRDWAADEGELLDENHDRGERLEAERAELAQQADQPAGATASEATGDDRTGATASDRDEQVTEQRSGRRISAFEEIRDGGFGVGSAAPLDDGAQPLDHPVAGFDDMTYRAPGDPGYDEARPDVWFYDEGAAQRSGFRRAEG